MSHGGHSDEGDIDVKALLACRLHVLQTFGDWKVWSVDGMAIRRHYVDFTEGGNPERYKWIPRRELWLDNANYREYRFVLLHEIREVNKMRAGMIYNKAHLTEANVVEVYARNHPSEVERLIAAEIALLVPKQSSRYGG